MRSPCSGLLPLALLLSGLSGLGLGASACGSDGTAVPQVPDAGARCGDGVAGGSEDCDGQDLRGRTCVGLGFTGGTLVCHPRCVYDVRGCASQVCGDGVVTGAEQCDDGNTTPGDCCDATCHAEPGCEVEPNDDPAHGQALAPSPEAVIRGWLRGADVDVYTVTVPVATTGRVTASLAADAVGPCPRAALELLDADGQVLARAAATTAAPCGSVTRAGLPPGPVHVRLAAAADAPAAVSYRVTVGLVTSPCGDGVRDDGQECDDGAVVAAGGCHLCRLVDRPETEPDDSFEQAVGPLTPPLALTGTAGARPDGTADEDWFTVALAHPTSLRVELFAGGADGCATLGFDLAVGVDFQGSFAPLGVATSPDDGGCAVVDTSQASLPFFGVPFVVRVVRGAPRAVPYRLVVTIVSECGDGIVTPPEACDGGPGCTPDCTTVPVCGNGVLDFSFMDPEECDDGNLVDGDGCDSHCKRELAPCAYPGDLCEVEYNGSPETVNSQLVPPVTMHAALSPASDVDYFGLSLQQGGDLRIATYDESGGAACAAPLATTLELYLAGTLIQTSTGGGPGGCALLRRTVPPGPYLVAVRAPGQPGPGPGPVPGPGLAPPPPPPAGEGAYRLVVTLDSTCGDGVIEGTETCDDVSVIACQQAHCAPRATCGDGLVTPPEDCDGEPGCRATCTLPRCGDGQLDPGEACDDGNLDAGDGCAPDCSIELPPRCGDGVVNQASEACDDGNLAAGDGCSALCQVEPGHFLEHEPNDDGAVAVATNDFSAGQANGPFTADVLIHASIAPVGDDDCFAIANPGGAPASVHLETFGPGGPGTCAGVDTELRLRDADGAFLAFDDDSGVGACSALDVVVPAGQTLYAQVTDHGDNSVIAAYLLQVVFK